MYVVSGHIADAIPRKVLMITLLLHCEFKEESQHDRSTEVHISLNMFEYQVSRNSSATRTNTQ